MHIHAPLDHVVFFSAWRGRSATEKLVFGGGLLLHASVLPALPWSIAVFGIAATAALAGARIQLRAWIRFMAPQVAFVSAAVLPLVFTIWPLGWSETGFAEAGRLWIRGVAAASCMTLLGLTTPVPDLLLAARRAHVPAVLIEMAFLVYRLIASIYELFSRLRLGLDLRLKGNRLRLSAASLSAGNLLNRSIAASRRLERGAAIRGIDGYKLLPPRTETSRRFVAFALLLQALLLACAVALRSRFPW